VTARSPRSRTKAGRATAGGKPENGVQQTRLLYAGANRMTAMRLASLDLPEGNAMRAPGEAPGLMALEIAMDEMAEKLGIDPVELRIINDTQVDPEKPERPFSAATARRVPAYRRRALRLEDARRTAGCGARRALARRHGRRSGVPQQPGAAVGARVRLDSAGMVTVETDMTDIGTGSYTIIAQTAAEMMGVGIDKVVVRLGDSNFPVSSGSGGQWGANSSTAGVYAACVKLREAVAQSSASIPRRAVRERQVRSGKRSVPLGVVAGASGIVAEDHRIWRSEQEVSAIDFRRPFRRSRRRCRTGEIRCGACWRCARPAAS
jgi:xanthine dehydrogenase YagR molybdenum-binding subunit